MSSVNFLWVPKTFITQVYLHKFGYLDINLVPKTFISKAFTHIAGLASNPLKPLKYPKPLLAKHLHTPDF